MENSLRNLQIREANSTNVQSKSALKAAISILQAKSDGDAEKPKPNWGIYTYFYNDGACDYRKSDTLKQGQTLYRNRKDDDATVFIAEGEVTRQKGDQVAIECCIGQALMQGNLKLKTYDAEKLYVVNHESNTIYNDVKKFDLD